MNHGLHIKLYFFYIIRSLTTGKLYLGYTPDDPYNRLEKHNHGDVPATKPYLPYEIIFFSAFTNKQDALNCEKYFKTTAGWKRLNRMLENALNDNNESLSRPG